VSTHTHSPLVQWTKPQLAAHIASGRHPEHIHPGYSVLARWTVAELLHYHQRELHNRCTHRRVVGYRCQACGTELGESLCPGGERV
jgi:hypothetical protein